MEAGARWGKTESYVLEMSSVCSGVLRMSVWSARHCLREYKGGQLEADLAADVNLTGCPCGLKAPPEFSPSHLQLASDMQSLLEASKQMLTEEIATDVAFLVR